ncbi:MAG: transposase [Alphaproteobacteria bacterium]|nr:transposase [Alphaproteobacteria bacterium]
MRVEQCWRSLKSGLRVRPVFHWRPWRIQAHVGISVIALLLERVAEIRTGDTWRNIRAALETIKVVEYERAGARIRQTTDVRPSVAALLRSLKVAPPPRLHAIEENPRKSSGA